MAYKVGDVCRVNDTYGFNTEERAVVGSVVQVTSVAPRNYMYQSPEIYVQVLFSAILHDDKPYVFYENELDLIT